jgi:hypothetical protein
MAFVTVKRMISNNCGYASLREYIELKMNEIAIGQNSTRYI